LKSKSREKTKGERLHGETAQPNEQNLKERLINGVHSSAIIGKLPYMAAGPKILAFFPIWATKLQGHRHLGQKCSVHDPLSLVT
jgi:hypothetical protein